MLVGHSAGCRLEQRPKTLTLKRRQHSFGRRPTQTACVGTIGVGEGMDFAGVRPMTTTAVPFERTVATSLSSLLENQARSGSAVQLRASGRRFHRGDDDEVKPEHGNEVSIGGGVHSAVDVFPRPDLDWGIAAGIAADVSLDQGCP